VPGVGESSLVRGLGESLLAAGHGDPGRPPWGAPAGRRPDGLGRQPGPGQQPSDHRVGVPRRHRRWSRPASTASYRNVLNRAIHSLATGPSTATPRTRAPSPATSFLVWTTDVRLSRASHRFLRSGVAVPARFAPVPGADMTNPTDRGRSGRRRSELERLIDRTVLGPTHPELGTCWSFTGTATPYGRIAKAQDTYTHRLGWKLLRGPIPEDKELHHRCGVYACWNPDHLQIASHAENLAFSRKSHCKHGHPLSGQTSSASLTAPSYAGLIQSSGPAGCSRGPIPDGTELHHRCGVHACWNPDHLEIVRHAENLAYERKSHCGRGHPLSGTNLRIDPRTGARICRACAAEYQRAFRDRKRSKPPGTPPE
jgi:HNH endonuclease